MKKYWLINVVGHEGYSFMIHGEADTEEQAINIANDNDLFDDASDAKIAIAEIADDNDIKKFKGWNMIHEI